MPEEKPDAAGLIVEIKRLLEESARLKDEAREVLARGAELDKQAAKLVAKLPKVPPTGN